jgi:hypothetical protein
MNNTQIYNELIELRAQVVANLMSQPLVVAYS